MATGSPAECSGLLEGDRIVEVNHASVEQCQHDELAARIMAVKDEVSLLVIDRDTEKLCADRGVSFVDPSNHVKHIMCPHLPPSQGQRLTTIIILIIIILEISVSAFVRLMIACTGDIILYIIVICGKGP